ncbi:MAG: preprotein translocase subunit SecE [Armatimonadetes bacterium]|nr:preprotein translocase subunit SecE [Armatimonadota bacterium]
MAKPKEVLAGSGSREKKPPAEAKKVPPRPERKAVAKEKVNRLDEIKKYFKSVYGELKKVHWPTRREVLVYTGVVFVSVVIIGIVIWIFDSLLSRLLQLILT